ncbi:MAG TPA: hypothetical protein VJ819_14640, partial [Nocardioidaceae bacterium]|nr:hypothetical protein [Nocardioidaceae bacterium]
RRDKTRAPAQENLHFVTSYPGASRHVVSGRGSSRGALDLSGGARHGSGLVPGSLGRNGIEVSPERCRCN